MRLNGKSVLIFMLLIILIAVFVWPSNSMKIRIVEDGNTIILSNGITVKLLGVSSTQEGKEELEGLIGNKVEIIPDYTAPFELSRLDKSSVVYAYVLIPQYEYECINSTILKQGKSTLVENCKDSLNVFRRYVAKGKELVVTPPTPTPVPTINYSEDDLKLPNYTPSGERKHSAWYTDGNLNLQMLDEACDYDLPYTKSFANQLAGRSEGNFNPGQICEIFDYCYKKWKYVNDPNAHEYVARASETIAASLTGDCDDFSVLMASCLLAVGANVCVNTGDNPSGGHAFTEVDISEFNTSDVLEQIRNYFSEYDISSLCIRQDGNRKWLNLDWQAAYPGGKYYDCSSRRDSYPCIGGKWSWKKIN